MRRCVLLLFLTMASTLLAQPARVPEIPFARSRISQAARRYVFRRGRRRRGQFQGPRLRLLARQHDRPGLRRERRAQLLEFDADGKFVREIGQDLYAWSFAHAVQVDKDDNIWAVDKGSDMVIKFNPEGRVAMVFGRKKEASDEGPGRGSTSSRRCRRSTACSASRPTSRGTRPATSTSATATSIRASPRSTRTATGSSRGASPATGPGQFNTPHSIAADAKGNVYVADRGNRRIQVFDGDGQVPARRSRSTCPFDPDAQPAIGNKPQAADRPATRHMAPGAPWAICITPRPTRCCTAPTRIPGRDLQADARRKGPGRARQVGQAAEAVRLDPRDRVPVGERTLRRRAFNWRVQKLILEPTH